MAYSCQRLPGCVFCDTAYPEFDDPIQGQVRDCCVIAALSSAAWVTNKITKLTSPPYNVLGVSVTDDLWLDPQLNPKQFGARSKTSTEIWPSIYEKAYAGNVCNISTYNGPGTAEDPLSRFSGCAKQGPRAVSFTEIKNSRCTMNKAKKPMVIHTKHDTGVNEGWDQIKIDHAYSILGHMQIGGIDHLVLRNPSGSIYPNGTTIPASPPNTNTNPNAVITGSWTVDDRVYDCLGNFISSRGQKTINFGQQGIFAIKASVLGNYFSSYAFAGSP
jgi:hypothetical protein